jgi:hypothetical protein
VARVLATAGLAASAFALPVPAAAAVFADVVSSTPVTAFVPVQRRDCAPVSGDSRTADDSEPLGGAVTSSPRCRTVTVRTQRVVAYDVVYEIAGERQSIRLDRDPGPRVELGVVAAAGSPAGRPVGVPVGRPVGQPVPVVVDDGGPVEAAPTHGYGEQAPLGARSASTTTTVIVGTAAPYGYGYSYGYGGYGYPYGPALGISYGYPWFGPSIGIGWRGGWGGHRHHWDGGRRSAPGKTMFPHRVGGGPAARR